MTPGERRLRPIIAALELHRVEPELFRREIGQQLGGDAGERHADAAIHADQVLVDVNRARAPLVVLELVGRARERDRHHAFGDVEAKRHAVGADRGDVVHFHGRYFAGVFERDAAFDAMVARLRVGDKRLQPIDAELDRPAEQHARYDRRDLIGIDVELHTEAAANVGGGHADLVLGDFQVLAEDLLHLERRLVRVDDSEGAIAGIEIGDEPARFERHGHLPLEA